MIKTIIFDLNGVLIKNQNFNDLFTEKYNIPKQEFLIVSNLIRSQLKISKTGSMFSYWKPFLDEWKLKITEKEFLDLWLSTEKSVPEMIEIVEKIKNKGIKLFILSNNYRERTDYYKKIFPFLSKIFQKEYYSWKTGFLKPEPEAFKIILKEQNINPNECLFFDDSLKNVLAAQKLGIRSFLFKNIELFLEDLKKEIPIS